MKETYVSIYFKLEQITFVESCVCVCFNVSVMLQHGFDSRCNKNKPTAECFVMQYNFITKTFYTNLTA